jgi:uncharacterized membrane protein YgcG
MIGIGVFALLLLSLAPGAWARGGGGCLERGTQVETPEGPRAIESLQVGDAVWSAERGERVIAHVLSTFEVEPEAYVELEFEPGGEVVRVTGEHLFATALGEFRRAASLAPGDRVLSWDARADVIVRSTKRVPAQAPAFNVLVDRGNTYFANHILVHNKGCFLPETPIALADGKKRMISEVKPGDRVRAFTADGALVETAVRGVITHEVDSYFVVTTEASVLQVTGEHPFFVGDGTFRTVERLKAGDVVYGLVGERLEPQRILSMSEVHTPTRVYNLQTDEPHTYFASGTAVHNKGGGFGGGHGGGFGGGGYHGGGGAYHSYGYGTRSCPPGQSCADDGDKVLLIFFLVLFGIFIFKRISDAMKDVKAGGLELDHLFTHGQIALKADKTVKLLSFISRTDSSVEPSRLETASRRIFEALQVCWEKREYTEMKPLMMADLFEQHVRQLAGMRRNHEINRIQDLRIESIHLVNVRYTVRPERREFTALITASARDYYVDDRSNAFMRGDRTIARFQEFWTFQFDPGKPLGWVLREIEQTRESRKLREENFFEQMTDRQVEHVYQAKVDALGPAGPALETETLSKATKIERMLNFLVATDKVWNHHAMLERAREVFTNVHMAIEAGTPAPVGPASGEPTPSLESQLAPEFEQALRARLEGMRSRGERIEYRNFCVRKVEILLVRNFADNRRDEFLVRVSAHAQRIFHRGVMVMNKDFDVRAFEEYWKFGRFGSEWRLKEALPSASGEKEALLENVDEESSLEMVKWYYTKKRAN